VIFQPGFEGARRLKGGMAHAVRIWGSLSLLALGCGEGATNFQTPVGGGSGGSASGAPGSGGAGGTAGSAAGVSGQTVGGAGGGAGSSAGSGGAVAAGTGGLVSGASGGGAAGSGSGTAGASGTTGGLAGAPSGGSGGSTPGNCTFTLSSQTADKAGPGGIPTVGIVDWSVDLAGLTSASIVFGTAGGTPMTAPAILGQAPNFRTLLLGMKGSTTYTFHVEVGNGTTTCSSPDYTITTGAVPNTVPPINRTMGPSAAAQDRGFILTNTRTNPMALILDADADPVWWAPCPEGCSRVQMSFDGQDMWMIGVNVRNQTAQGGEVRRVSMDGLTTEEKVSGLSNCHHDLTVLPSGGVACMSWTAQSGDQPSDLIERDREGNLTTIVRDSNVYVANRYHANAIHYHPSDDSYTISDRGPNLFVKVSRAGDVLWQFGGSCSGAPAPNCIAGDWQVNHGHHLLEDGSGTFLFFNNGSSGASTIFKYTLVETGTFSADEVWAYEPGSSSGTLGDVQQLSNGNVMVVFTNAGLIHEIDASNELVQSLTGAGGGYIVWRPTLYGPPPRL